MDMYRNDYPKYKYCEVRGVTNRDFINHIPHIFLNDHMSRPNLRLRGAGLVVEKREREN